MQYRFFKGITLAIACLWMMPLAATSQETIPNDPAMRQGKLPNGFSYFLRKNNKPASEIMMRLAVKAGFYHEDADQKELAHLLEHLAFNGTKHYPGDGIREFFNASGFKPGTNWNASTSSLYTDYFMNIPSGKQDIYSKCFQVLRDWAQDMTLTPEAIDAERGVVMGEMRYNDYRNMRENAVIARRAAHPMYPVDWRALHEHNILNFKYPSLLRFYKDWYRPELMAVIIVGDIDVDATEKMIQQLFGDLKTPDQPRQEGDLMAKFKVPMPGRKQFISMQHKEDKAIEIKIIQKRAAGNQGDRLVSDIRSDLIDELYSAMVRHRLEELSEDQSLLNGVFQIIQRDGSSTYKDQDELMTSISLIPDQSPRNAVNKVWAEIHRIARDGFSAAEFKQAQAETEVLIRSEESSRESNASIAANFQDHFVFGTAAPSAEQFTTLSKQLLEKITLEEVNRFAKAWIKEDVNMDVVIFGPEDKQLPDSATMFAWLNAAAKVKLPAYRPKEPISKDFSPYIKITPVDAKSALVSVKKIEELGVTEAVLSNGLRLVLKPLATEKEEIMMKGFRPGGLTKYSEEDVLQASRIFAVSNPLYLKFGKERFAKFLSEHDLRTGLGLEANSSILSGSCKTSDMEHMLQLLYINMNNPVKDTAYFRSRIEADKRIQWAVRGQSGQLYTDSMNKLTFTDDRYARPWPTDAQYAKLNLDRMYDIHRKEFSTPAAFTIILTGRFNPDEAIAQFIKYFGSAAPAPKQDTPPAIYTRAFTGKQDKTFYVGLDTMASVNLFYPGTYAVSQRNDIILQLLGEAFDISMMERIREKEGGAYSVASAISKGRELGDHYAFSVTFLPAMNNVEPMIAASVEELKKLQQNGVSEALFRQAKERVLYRYRLNLQERYFWAQYLEDQYRFDGSLDEVLKIPGIIDLISLEELNQAARRYFTTDNMMRFVSMPKTAKQ